MLGCSKTATLPIEEPGETVSVTVFTPKTKYVIYMHIVHKIIVKFNTIKPIGNIINVHQVKGEPFLVALFNTKPLEYMLYGCL